MPLGDLWPAWHDDWVLAHDEDLLVIDKPAGISTHSDGPDQIDDAHTRLAAWLRSRGDDPYLGIHQRLDRDTSGVLLFTRRRAANPSIAAQFERRQVDKHYLAGVQGAPARPRDGVLRHRLLPGPSGSMRALPASAKRGQEAVARWRILERLGDRTLLELTPETGRTHQLRVQLAAEGRPIAGDDRYQGAPAPRLMLHASSLGLVHPSGGKRVYRAPTPPVFDRWMRASAIDLRDREDVKRALRAAAEQRYGLAHRGDTDAFRLANGVGDGLPGLDVDRYGEHLVIALSTEEAVAAREEILDAAASLGAAGVYLKLRPKHASRIVDARREEFAPRTPVRGEPAPESFTVQELGLSFEVRLGDGLSTGIFLDQRENRRRVRELSRGARVLNLFAYTGAFTVAAAAGGARASTTVDVSRGALAWARKNLDAIGAGAEQHALIEADALIWLERAAEAKPRWDLTIFDPPSFATTKQTLFSAESDYRKVAALAMRVTAPGGKLLACTNHRGIARAKLRRHLHEAARLAGREVTQMKDLPDPSDFPPEPGHESHLKSLLVTLA